jgi:transcription elongation factor Elf1
MNKANFDIRKFCGYCRKERVFVVLIKKGFVDKYFLKCKSCNRFCRRAYIFEMLFDFEVLE